MENLKRKQEIIQMRQLNAELISEAFFGMPKDASNVYFDLLDGLRDGKLDDFEMDLLKELNEDVETAQKLIYN
jgi:hypothetical protein